MGVDCLWIKRGSSGLFRMARWLERACREMPDGECRPIAAARARSGQPVKFARGRADFIDSMNIHLYTPELRMKNKACGIVTS
jgi:hypothetical protein